MIICTLFLLNYNFYVKFFILTQVYLSGVECVRILKGFAPSNWHKKEDKNNLHPNY
jgi:hypothetical protein